MTQILKPAGLPWLLPMPEADASVYAILVIAVVAVIGLGLALASFATDRSMQNMMGTGGPMMNGSGGGGTAQGPGALEWTVLILSIALVAVAIALLWRSRSLGARSVAPAQTTAAAPTIAAVTSAATTGPAAAPMGPTSAASVPEPALVKLLDEDERRMYLELRSHGGQMLQRDLVALGMFSKAKVTRVLDKLEAKGVVVREAHGMTNRVRLVGTASK